MYASGRVALHAVFLCVTITKCGKLCWKTKSCINLVYGKSCINLV